ncbi:hypothetical protein [Polaromonas sp.]|uniref:hypothetical protein n=1 Tax=Polaromonas sp. TaxID=1869339 RepID=UPI002B6DF8E7|nr:hypothetical protein [Polaromonas sp.]HQS31275.1 hypothetical protein [Polaromonas sp.]HQS90397.1 hypothetical protein [Polaromonas sp.]
MITDFVSGLAALPDDPVLAGTGGATTFLPAAGAAGLPEAFFATGLAGAAFFGTGLADAVLEAATGLVTAFTTGLTGLAPLAALTGVTDLTGLTGFVAGLVLLATGRAAVFGADLAFGVVLTAARALVFSALFAGVTGFFLVVAFTIGLLWKSAPHGWCDFSLAERPQCRPA